MRAAFLCGSGAAARAPNSLARPGQDHGSMVKCNISICYLVRVTAARRALDGVADLSSRCCYCCAMGWCRSKIRARCTLRDAVVLPYQLLVHFAFMMLTLLLAVHRLPLGHWLCTQHKGRRYDRTVSWLMILTSTKTSINFASNSRHAL